MADCSYSDVATLKRRFAIADANTIDDTRLHQILRAVTEKLEGPGGCRRHFAVRQATRYYSGSPAMPGRLSVEDLLSVTSMAIDQGGSGTYDATLASDDYLLWPYEDDRWPKLAIELDARTGTYREWPRTQRAVQVIGTWGYGDGQSATPYHDSGATVTVATATATTATVSDAALLAVGQTVLVGSEQMYLTGLVNGTTDSATVKRGANGTTAAAHTSAAAAYVYDYPDALREACLLQAMRIYLRNKAPFGVLGTGSMETPVVIPKLDPDVQAMIADAGLIRRRY